MDEAEQITDLLDEAEAIKAASLSEVQTKYKVDTKEDVLQLIDEEIGCLQRKIQYKKEEAERYTPERFYHYLDHNPHARRDSGTFF